MEKDETEKDLDKFEEEEEEEDKEEDDDFADEDW